MEKRKRCNRDVEKKGYKLLKSEPLDGAFLDGNFLDGDFLVDDVVLENEVYKLGFSFSEEDEKSSEKPLEPIKTLQAELSPIGFFDNGMRLVMCNNDFAQFFGSSATHITKMFDPNENLVNFYDQMAKLLGDNDKITVFGLSIKKVKLKETFLKVTHLIKSPKTEILPETSSKVPWSTKRKS